MAHNSLALVLRDGPGPDLSLTLRGNAGAVQSYNRGPGRLLHKVYMHVGKKIEAKVNRTAHNLGFGPLATASRIEKAFLGVEDVQSMLDHLYLSCDAPASSKINIEKLEKDCQKLIEYADRY